MEKSYFKNTYFVYTCTFLILLPIVFLPFFLEGRSFVWHLDGLDQHYPILLHYGSLLRGFLSGKGFPMVDFKLGLGFDTITTLGYYVLGDPLGLLAVFMTPKNSILFYGFLILLRFYLAGISFILLMKYFKREGQGIILGALIYVFSGYALYAGLRHPFFMNPMIYLPLILLGVEKVLRRKKPYLMIVMFFISAMSNFYLLYELTIITVIYIIFRYFILYKKDYKNIIAGLLLTGLRTGGYYLLGIALASFVLIPVLYAFTQNGRLNTGPGMISGYFHYPGSYYLTLFQGIFTAGLSKEYWTVLSFSSVAVVSLAILMSSKRYKQLKLIYLLSFLGLFVPAFGYFMNGFSYTANRWCFLLSLLVAITFTFTFDELLNLGKKDKYILSAEIGIYGILAFAFTSADIVKIMFFALLFIMFLILILQIKWFRDKKTISRIIIYILVVLSLGLNGYGLYSKQFGDYTHDFLAPKEVKKLSTKGTLTLIPEIKDKSFYRIETYGEKALNSALTVGFHDVSGYYSLMDGDVTSYLKNLEVLSQKTAIRFDNLDNRTILDTLACVKYFVSTDISAVPYGYKLLKELNTGSGKYYLFQNSYALPLGYTYKNYMLKEDYDKLNALDKQNAMMEAVILNQNTDYANQADYNLNSGIEKLDVRITPDANVLLSNNTIEVKKPGATITLDFNSKPNSETYIRFGKLKINGKQNIMINFYAKGDQGVNKKVNVRSFYYNSYFGKENFLINAGYSISGETRAVITFPEINTFLYDKIEVYSIDMSNYVNRVMALNNATLSNIKRYNNSIRGDITLDKKGVMVLSIPYSKGWSAYVDGVKEKVLQANVMYMALPLEAGSHHIILKYQTPYLKSGGFVSILTLVILLGIIIYNKSNIYHNKA